MSTEPQKTLIVVIVASVVVVVVFSYILVNEIFELPQYASRIMNTSATHTVNVPETRTKSVKDLIREHLSVIKPEVRTSAIQILNNYLNSSSTIVSKRLYIGPGRRDYIGFHAYSSNVYRIRIYVQGTCIIGSCDIEVELRDSRLNTVRYFGRKSFLETEVTLQDGDYYIYLDNSYALLNSKTVDVTITARFTREAFNDDVYKMVVIALWVAEHVNYVSDPKGFEYIAPPEETLKTKAGDCDDYAVLLASLYRSVGLEAGVGLIDTDGDGKAEHATALVYFTENPSNLLEKMKAVLQVIGVKTRGISYFNDKQSGIWVIVDPSITYGSIEPWYVSHEPYKLVELIKP